MSQECDKMMSKPSFFALSHHLKGVKSRLYESSVCVKQPSLLVFTAPKDSSGSPRPGAPAGRGKGREGGRKR